MRSLPESRTRVADALDFAFFLAWLFFTCGLFLICIAWIKMTGSQTLEIAATVVPLLVWVIVLPRLRERLDAHRPSRPKPAEVVPVRRTQRRQVA